MELIDMTDYVHHKSFDIVSTKAVKRIMMYPCCVEKYPDLRFNMTLLPVAKRR